MASGICSDGNFLPIDLDMSQMINSSQQLTNLTYDFAPEKSFQIKLECPSWMKRINGCTTGAIEIVQDTNTKETDNNFFVSVGKVRGPKDGKNRCYYFPRCLNYYNGAETSGGEVVIELVESSNKDKDKEKVRLLIFIPVNTVDNPSADNMSHIWFENICPETQVQPSSGPGTDHISQANVSFNQIIPKAPFWVYNNIKFHGEKNCGGSEENEFKATHAIFFSGDSAITISTNRHDIFNQITNSKPTTHIDISTYIDISNNTEDWKKAWFKTYTPNPDTGQLEEQRKERDFRYNKVNKGSIFRNELGTTLGPGDHTDKGDPFSLTCEPIVDTDDKPIEGKDRLEWVKDVYGSVPKSMKNLLWVVIFIIILTGILITLYSIIFKNIGLFITQNEIAGRGDK